MSVKKLDQMELVLAYVLRYGVILCLSITGFGLCLRLLGIGSTSMDSAVMLNTLTHGGVLWQYKLPSTTKEFWVGILALQPDVIMAFGLVLLIALPIFRVAMTVFLFVIERDWIYFFITLIVLSVLLTGVFMGKII